MSSAVKSVAEIPTVSQLFRRGELKPSTEEDLPTPNQQLNNKVCTYKGDITTLECDAIVNAANRRLLGGGGVDGAIHRAAGPGLLRECRTVNGCETGSAKITDAYNLPCKKVIHAVGPVYKSIEESEPHLRSAYRTSLKLAVENDCKTIAFPAISTGVYGYPSKAAARAASREVYRFLTKPEGQKLDRVVFCNFLDKDVTAYAECLPYVPLQAPVRSSTRCTDFSGIRLVFAPTEDDLSHTGECTSVANGSPKEMIPTNSQTRPKEAYDPGHASRCGVMVGQTATTPSTNQTGKHSPGGAVVRQSILANAATSPDSDVRPSAKTSRDACSGNSTIDGDDRVRESTEKGIDSLADVVEHTRTTSTTRTSI
ncbi:LRP16 family protein [Cladophialophora carrionii]|uniref:LRP16 family protein n=1 Tax=Cladophialophora carrionii TaxID=86049 RepID=A0A1C1CCM2_9EURO|nr:LRP16 family protein [Cladophialophora carrionii]